VELASQLPLMSLVQPPTSALMSLPMSPPMSPPLMSYTAALLLAAPELGCQMAFPLPSRPLELPLSLPSLTPGE